MTGFGMQWHQLDHTQTICTTSLQTDYHTNTSTLNFSTDSRPFLAPNQQCQSTEGIFIILRHHTHTHTFNGPLSGTTQVSRYQKGKTYLDFTEARDSGISWAISKSAPRSRQITTPAPHHSVFYRLDALPAAQPTASKH